MIRIRASTRSRWRRFGYSRLTEVDDEKLPIEKPDLNKYQGAFVDAGTTLIYGPTYVIK